VFHEGKLRIYSVTWNMHAKPPPADLSLLLPVGQHHLYAVGTEECERGIAGSLLRASKPQWEKRVAAAMGEQYCLIASRGLGATHLAVFIHRALVSAVSDVQSAAVACGVGNRVGNKGGVGVSFMIGKTSFLFVNCHLAAHQNAVARRNRDYWRIETQLPLIPAAYGIETQLAVASAAASIIRHEETLAKQAEAKAPRSPKAPKPAMASEDEDDEDDDEEEAEEAEAVLDNAGKAAPAAAPALPQEQRQQQQAAGAVGDALSMLFARLSVPAKVSDRFDRVIWMGDLNYRIDAPRDAVDCMLHSGDFDGMWARDQLQAEHGQGRVFRGFVEPSLLFLPTYKLDRGTNDSYDSSGKRRVPSWTDRILYKVPGLAPPPAQHKAGEPGDSGRHPEASMAGSPNPSGPFTPSYFRPLGPGGADMGRLDAELQPLSYVSLSSICSSDHLPVAAVFVASLRTTAGTLHPPHMPPPHDVHSDTGHGAGKNTAQHGGSVSSHQTGSLPGSQAADVSPPPAHAGCFGSRNRNKVVPFSPDAASSASADSSEHGSIGSAVHHPAPITKEEGKQKASQLIRSASQGRIETKGLDRKAAASSQSLGQTKAESCTIS
jgi:hypothetical protein